MWVNKNTCVILHYRGPAEKKGGLKIRNVLLSTRTVGYNKEHLGEKKIVFRAVL